MKIIKIMKAVVLIALAPMSEVMNGDACASYHDVLNQINFNRTAWDWTQKVAAEGGLLVLVNKYSTLPNCPLKIAVKIAITYEISNKLSDLEIMAILEIPSPCTHIGVITEFQSLLVFPSPNDSKITALDTAINNKRQAHGDAYKIQENRLLTAYYLYDLWSTKLYRHMLITKEGTAFGQHPETIPIDIVKRTMDHFLIQRNEEISEEFGLEELLQQNQQIQNEENGLTEQDKGTIQEVVNKIAQT